MGCRAPCIPIFGESGMHDGAVAGECASGRQRQNREREGRVNLPGGHEETAGRINLERLAGLLVVRKLMCEDRIEKGRKSRRRRRGDVRRRRPDDAHERGRWRWVTVGRSEVRV